MSRLSPGATKRLPLAAAASPDTFPVATQRTVSVERLEISSKSPAVMVTTSGVVLVKVGCTERELEYVAKRGPL